MTAHDATYVYCVTRSGREPGPLVGIDGESLTKVSANGIAAFVSDVSGRDLVLGRQEMDAHARVLEQAMHEGTVLPVRFGVVMPGPDAVLTDLLLAHHEELERQLEELDGTVELRLRAIYDEQALMREVVREHPAIAQRGDAVSRMPDDASHFARIELGEAVAAAVAHKREIDADAMVSALSRLAIATEVAELSHERIVFSASFLIDADRIAEFDAAVDDLGRRHADRIRFTYTGPLAPASFVRLSEEA